ncbi:site-specific integrase [Enterococcus hulanensis]|uniref:tyrosine-type recombinase/integrase n=1 Tax=Enterococcus hulanensis TaxID=2559929 RepID=UPI001A8CA9A3|nr:site-specific integrase [Enterococcus hulanensis]MBO0456899.1 site-specific integrase [Enterococcus hulanensis]
MSVEKIYRKKHIVAYRSNVYYKSRRYLGERRKTKKEAELDEVNQKRDFLTGSYFEETKRSLDNGYEDYMLLLAPKRLSYNSIVYAKNLYNKHIKPEFGFREMVSIKPLEIQRFLTKKENELANSTIIKIYSLLNQLYKMMIKWDELKNNPLDGVTKPSPNYREKKIWTKEESKQFLVAAEECQSFMAFWLALQFGLRLGEVQGLQWEKIDFENRLLHVEQAYHEEEKKLGRLKSKASKRSIPISQRQVDFLQTIQKKQIPKSKLVTSNSEGGFLMKRNIRRAMTSVCKQAGIKKISFHELRHTHATLMLEMNEHPKIVQQRLGHAKVETTLNIYSHVRPQVHRDSAERFSNFFDAS